MRRILPVVLGLFVFVLLTAAVARAETITQEFKHNLLVNQPAQSWEHRIDIPEDCQAHGMIFVKRNLFLMGKLVIEREEFTPAYYYVKVSMPKHPGEPVAGVLKVTIDLDKKPCADPIVAPATDLKLMDGCASRYPIFTWKGNNNYAAITLYDADTNQTIWERVICKHSGAGYDEITPLPLHHYKWAVKLSDATGRWSKETQAAFKIVQQGGAIVAIPE